MSRSPRFWLLVLGLGTAVWALSTPAALAQPPDEDEVAVPLGRVPAAVMKAAQKAVPGVNLAKATRTVEEGKTYFDLIGRDEQGREVDVEVTARGQVVGVGVEVPMTAVPRVVLAALKAKGKGMTFTDAEVVTLGGRVLSYRFEGHTPLRKDVEATVSTDGRTVDLDVDN